MTTRRVNLNTESVDNYLKAIFTLGGPGEERVTSTALAEKLGVAPASITNMLQKLAASPKQLVEYESRRGVRLSPTGRLRALGILRHHRLLETFLYKILDYPIEEVHDEAERLEHFISERLEERIDAKLRRPKFDPHGHCIPALYGKMPAQRSKPLTDLKESGKFLVDSVSDSDAALLKRLTASYRGRVYRFPVTPTKGSFCVQVGPRRLCTCLGLPPVLSEFGLRAERVTEAPKRNCSV